MCRPLLWYEIRIEYCGMKMILFICLMKKRNWATTQYSGEAQSNKRWWYLHSSGFQMEREVNLELQSHLKTMKRQKMYTNWGRGLSMAYFGLYESFRGGIHTNCSNQLNSLHFRFHILDLFLVKWMNSIFIVSYGGSHVWPRGEWMVFSLVSVMM